MSSADTVVDELRAEITELDRQIVAAVNRRLGIVRRLHDHKQVTGMPLRDLEREIAMLRYLEVENAGPLSDQGLAGLYTYILELTREELHGK